MGRNNTLFNIMYGIILRGVSGIIKFDMVLLVILIISIIIYFLGTFGVTKIDIEGIDRIYWLFESNI